MRPHGVVVRVFDWVRFLDENRVPYITRGANVSRGEVNIRCPFCGSADPSQHMGLNLENGWWSCWRNRAAHSGKSPLRLIMRLLGITYHEAREIAGLGDDYVDPEGFDAIAARILKRSKGEGKPVAAERRYLDLDRSFYDLTDSIRTRRQWNYLYKRGFSEAHLGIEDVDRLVKAYNLKAGCRGNWTDRVIIPYYEDRQLVTWTGRAIGEAAVRYKDLETKESLIPPKETLFNIDCMFDDEAADSILVVQEGPFDAMKVDFYGRELGVRSVALSTNSMSEEQSFLLKAAERHFKRIVIVMDEKSEFGAVDSARMRWSINFINCSFARLPEGVPDGGAMTPPQVRNWCRYLRSN